MQLPPPRVESAVPVETALRARRSHREYAAGPLALAELSQLLWAAQGVTTPEGYRTAPSAGALYTLEVCVLTSNVTDLATAIYHYAPHSHALRKVVDGDHRRGLTQAALHQSSITAAPVVIVITAVYERTMAKYGPRGERYVHMEAGHAAQNVYLQAVAPNLATVAIGAFSDEAVARVLQLPDREQPLYLLPIGRR
jgi:SagB-type dehydrogenase family enzyme